MCQNLSTSGVPHIENVLKQIRNYTRKAFELNLQSKAYLNYVYARYMHTLNAMLLNEP